MKTPMPIHPAPIEWQITESGLILKVEVPGVSPDDLDIEATETTLKLQWHRPQVSSAVALYSELRYGEFGRFVTLPFPIDGDRIETTLKNGILTLRLPKREQPKAVPVTLVPASALGSSRPVVEDPWAA